MSTVTARQTDVLLFPRQWQFVTDSARFPGYVGGIGSGKTFAGAVKAITRLDRPGLGMVAAPTYSMLRDATQRTLLGQMAELGIGYEFRKGENAVTVPASGHEIIFRSLDDPEKVRGPNLDWAWIDEASLIPRMAWSIVIGRVRVGTAPQVWATFTPKGRNWCWDVWERDADPNHPLYRVRTEENPELPQDFAQSLGYVGVFADQELGGQFVAHEGLVYPGFQRAAHVRVVDTEDWRRVLGVDVGTRNPTAILDARIAGDGRVHIAGEVYRRNMGTSDVLDAIRATAMPRDIDVLYIDPSAADYRMDLEAEGYPVAKADNAVITGIGRVTTALAEGLTIDPSCVNLIAEFESYSYPEGGRVEKDAPIKQNDHALDALRYIVSGEAEPQPQYWIA